MTDAAILLASLGSCAGWTQADIQREWKHWTDTERIFYREHREWAIEAGLSREDAARFGAAAAVAWRSGRFREWSRESRTVPATPQAGAGGPNGAGDVAQGGGTGQSIPGSRDSGSRVRDVARRLASC